MAHEGKLQPEQMLHERDVEFELRENSDVRPLMPASYLVELLKDDRWEKLEAVLDVYFAGLHALAGNLFTGDSDDD